MQTDLFAPRQEAPSEGRIFVDLPKSWAGTPTAEYALRETAQGTWAARWGYWDSQSGQFAPFRDAGPTKKDAARHVLSRIFQKAAKKRVADGKEGRVGARVSEWVLEQAALHGLSLSDLADHP
jgi:hypothetical protein